MNNQLLINEIKSIRSDLYDLNDYYEKLYSVLNTNVVIDKETIRNSDLTELKTDVNDIINEITVDIIPMINNM